MANPFYQQMMQMMNPGQSGGPVSQNPQMPAPMTFANPMQKMQYILQAMQNPAAFVRQRFPDIPEQIQNNPAQIMNYLRQTRGISDQQMQQVTQDAQQIVGQGTVR